MRWKARWIQVKSLTQDREPSRQEIVITHIVDAPRERVFSMYTDPALMPEWWGPRSLTTAVDRMDVRSGGSWRVVQRDPDGNEYAFRGVYHEVAPPERVINTFEWEGEPGHVMLETVTFEDLGENTRIVDRVVFQSAADRDAAVQSGMEEGVMESMERFTGLLAAD